MITSLELLSTTTLIALLSAIGAALLGYPVGNWLASLGRRGRELFGSAMLLPFLLPPFLIGISLLPLQNDSLDSISGILWIVSAHILMNIGFIARTVSSLAVPREQLEAAGIDGASSLQTRLLVTLPQQLPGLSAATLLVALYSATSYGLVLTLGRGSVLTLETQIAEAALRNLDLATAGLLALLQTALTLSFFLIARRLGAEPAPLFGESESARSPLGAVLGVAAAALTLALIGQVAVRAINSGGGLLANLQLLVGRGARDILNISVAEAAGNSLRNLAVALAIAMPLAWLAAGGKKPRVWYLLPVGISPVVFGLIFLVLSGYLPASLRGWWLVPLVQALFLFPLGYQILRPARAAIDPEMLEAASLDGVGGLRRALAIEFPILNRSIAGAVAFVSLASLGEFGAASFLAFGSEATLPLVMFRLASRPGAENLGMAMTAALLFIALAFVIVLVISREAQTERQYRKAAYK